MQSTTVLTAIALLAAAISTPLLAGDQKTMLSAINQNTTEKRSADGFDHGMQTVVHDACCQRTGPWMALFFRPVHAARRCHQSAR